MEGFVYSIGRMFYYSADLLIILVPIVIVLILIYLLAFPKDKNVGGLLMIGTGILGYFMIKSKLTNALAVEDRIAKYNKDMAAFKERQKMRANAVIANKTIITTLEKRAESLKKNESKYNEELTVINAEVKERKELNEKILNDTESFVTDSEKRSLERRKLLEQAKALPEVVGMVPFVASETTGEKPAEISIEGFTLLEVL